MEEFPQLREVVDRGFDDPANVDLVSPCGSFFLFQIYFLDIFM